MSLTGFLTQTCSVQSITDSASPLGGNIKTFANRITSLPCLLNQRRFRTGESVEFGKVTSRDTNVLYCEANTSALTIVSSDRITLGSKSYEVIQTPYNTSQKTHHMQIEVEEVT